MKNRRGQGVLELVVAIGVISLVLGGVVTLLIQVMGARGRSFDRKKATRLSSIVMESLVKEKENDPEAFWQLNSRMNETMAGFSGYVYSVGFTNVINGFGCGTDDLGVGVTDCAQVTLDVGWSGSSDQSVRFTRFFSK